MGFWSEIKSGIDFLTFDMLDLDGSQKPPDIPPAPPPASYYSYDAEGNPSGEQVWDAERNAYVYKPAPLTEAQKAEKAQRDTLRSQFLSNLSETPEDRIKAYQQYADTMTSAMSRSVDEQYGKIVRSTEESMNARGMTGSRAYVDTLTELAKDKQTTDVDIAERAGLAKEDLAYRDRSYWMSSLNALDAGARGDAVIEMNKANVANQGAYQGTAGRMGQYQADTFNAMNKWQIELENKRAKQNMVLDTATGLAFLYGFGGGGSSGGSSVVGGRKGTSILAPQYRSTRFA